MLCSSACPFWSRALHAYGHVDLAEAPGLFPDCSTGPEGWDVAAAANPRGRGTRSALLSREGLQTLRVQQCQRSMHGAGGRPPALGGGDGWGDSSLEHLQAPTPKSDCLCQPGSSHILPPGLSGKPVVLSKEGAQLLLRPLCFQFSLPLIFPRKATLVNSLRAAFWENRFLSLLDHSPSVPDY